MPWRQSPLKSFMVARGDGVVLETRHAMAPRRRHSRYIITFRDSKNNYW